MAEVSSVPVRLIDRNWDVWPRVDLDGQRVKEFAALMQEEGVEALPPVILCGPYEDGWYALEDGFHRFEAAQQAGMENLPAVVLPPKSDADLRFEMVRHSAVASKTLTMAEKRAVAPILRDEGRAISDIARALGVARCTLYRWFEDSPSTPARSTDRDQEQPAIAKAKALLRSLCALRAEVGADDVQELCRRMSPLLARAAQDQFGDDGALWLSVLYGAGRLAYHSLTQE